MFPGFLIGAVAVGLSLVLGADKGVAIVLGIVGMILTAVLKTVHLSRANRYLLTTRRVIIKN